MSILDALFGGLFGTDDQDQQREEMVERPCSNCPGYCKIAPEACSVCEPFKERMIDAIYWVEHKEELLSQYEVTGVNEIQSGAVTCPHCGGHSEDPYVCEYCGSKLAEGSGKIKVASASDIPNPVLEAQEIIFKRYEAVKDFDGADEAYGLVDALSGVENEGMLSSIFNALLGAESTNDSKTLGNRMSESEIGEMAAFYGVSVADYLTGLDNGKYLTLSNKKTAAKAEEQYISSHSGQQSGGLSQMAGLAGMIGLGSMLFGGSSYNYNAARKPSYHRPTVVVNPSSYPAGNTGSNKRPNISHMPKPFRPSASQSRPPVSQVRPQAPQLKPSASPVRPQAPQPKPSASPVRPQAPQLKPSASPVRPQAPQPKPSAPQSRPAVSSAKPKTPSPTVGGAAKIAGKSGSGPKQAEKISAHLNKEKDRQNKVAQKVQSKTPKK